MKVSVAAALAILAGSASALAPLHTGQKVIPGQYIVALRKDADLMGHIASMKSQIAAISPASEIFHTYEIGNFKGYAVRCTPEVLVCDADTSINGVHVNTSTSSIGVVVLVVQRKTSLVNTVKTP